MDRYLTFAKELSRRCPSLEVRLDEPMAKHTTFRIGGPVKVMALPRSVSEASEAVHCATELGIEPIFIGNGSDLLVSDSGIDGFIVKTVDGLGALRADGTSVAAGSGVLLSSLACFALSQGLSGLEFAHGIPGSLGGAITMDAGAYDGDMSMVVRSVSYLDETGTACTLEGAQLDFSYRHSAFSDGRRLILGAELSLKHGNPVSIKALMDDLGNRRRHKQPLDLPSAGSTFKRPVGYYAAALIDECKLKGVSVGGAQVSTKHAGFIVNTGNATCKDVLTLVELVRETVLRETGVALELEIKTLGI